MRVIFIAFTLALALVVAPSTTSSAASAMSAPTFDKRLHKQTNKARAAHDRKKLKKGKCFDRFAQRQAKRMAKQQRMFHQNLRTVLRKCGARAVAENVAYGFTRPKANVRAWMNSTGHRRNLLDRAYTRLGIGVAKGKDGRFYTVQVFGRPG